MLPQRKFIRLRDYDYLSKGYYFITICTKDREHLFGDIGNGAMQLNEFGKIVNETWQWLFQRYPYIHLDQWMIMPNHFHGILIIENGDHAGGSRTTNEIKRKPLGRLIGAFKTVSTKHINQLRNSPGISVWQRNYYERVIRSEHELNETRQYILDNPAKWDQDPENVLVSAQ